MLTVCLMALHRFRYVAAQPMATLPPLRGSRGSREPGRAPAAISGMELIFKALFEAHYDPIASYLLRRVDRSSAEDIAATTFLEAFDRRATFDPERGTPRSWLFGIATNLMRHHFREEQTRLRAYSRAAAREIESSDGWDEICARLDARASAGAIAAALANLERADYEVLTLVAWTDLSGNEIAAALKIPPGTQKTRLLRARRQMREQLERSTLETSHG